MTVSYEYTFSFFLSKGIKCSSQYLNELANECYNEHNFKCTHGYKYLSVICIDVTFFLSLSHILAVKRRMYGITNTDDDNASTQHHAQFILNQLMCLRGWKVIEKKKKKKLTHCHSSNKTRPKSTIFSMSKEVQDKKCSCNSKFL